MRRAPLIVVFGLVGALLASGYGVLFTLLDDLRDEYGMSEAALGAVIGIGFVSGFIAQVTIAPLADRGHARRLVIGGILLDIAGLVVMAFSQSIPPLLAGRFVMGIGVGIAVPAIRRIVIVADPANLGRNLGRLLAADVTGFAAGPAVSAVLVGPLGIPAPFLVIAASTAVLLPVVAGTFVEESDVPSSGGQRFAFDLLRLRPFAGAVALGSSVWLMIGAFDALWSLSLDDLDAPEWLANLGITLFALPLAALGAVGGRLAQRVGPFRVGTIGLLLGAAYMALYGYMPSGMAMFAVAMVHALSDGLSVSSTGVAVGMVVSKDRQAGAQGVLGGIQTLFAGVTAPVIGALYEHHGRDVAYTVSAVGWSCSSLSASCSPGRLGDCATTAPRSVRPTWRRRTSPTRAWCPGRASPTARRSAEHDVLHG